MGTRQGRTLARPLGWRVRFEQEKRNQWEKGRPHTGQRGGEVGVAWACKIEQKGCLTYTCLPLPHFRPDCDLPFSHQLPCRFFTLFPIGPAKVLPCLTGSHTSNQLLMQLTHHLDDGGSKNPWNTGKLLPKYMVPQPIRRLPSYLPPWEPQISLSSYLFNSINQLIILMQTCCFLCGRGLNSYILFTDASASKG
jgi:hypothetical protein